MKLFIGLLIVGGLFGQTAAPPITATGAATPSNFVSGGASFNQETSPQFSGFVSYAQQISGGTYSYNVVDITSLIIKPAIKLQATESTGIAQYVKTVGKVDIFALAAAGVAVGSTTAGSTVGASFSGGGMGVIGISGGWSLIVPVRVIHSTVGGTQYMIGLGVGWGK